MYINAADNVEDRDRSQRPLSPCVLVCTLDEDQVCLGCRRSLEQISGWALMTKDEQWAVIDQLVQGEATN